MDCKEFRERLDLYVDGELSGEGADEARAHSKGCATCAKAEAGLRHLRSSLKRVVNRHQPPPGLEREVLSSLRSGRPGISARAERPLDESRRLGTQVWRAQVVVPAPFFALLVLSLVALVGWLVFALGTAKRQAPVASGGFEFFSGHYRGERASIQVVRRASLESRSRGK